MSYHILVTSLVHCPVTDAVIGTRTTRAGDRNYLTPLMAIKMAEVMNRAAYEAGGDFDYCAVESDTVPGRHHARVLRRECGVSWRHPAFGSCEDEVPF